MRPRLPMAALDHRRFWEAMDALSQADLLQIERRLSLAAIDLFDLDLSGLVLDMTNFATFIDSANDRAPIARRGNAKQKRNDLRLVGQALVVTCDGAIPIVSHPYPGNSPARLHAVHPPARPDRRTVGGTRRGSGGADHHLRLQDSWHRRDRPVARIGRYPAQIGRC